MRCSSSSKQSSKLSTEVERHKNKEEPHLSVVPISCDAPVMNEENSHPQNPSDGLTEAHKLSPPQHPPRPPRKQMRRRLHTSRPYQERLLNMAEARREIVAALKFHRAAMKQASEEQKQQHQQPPPQATASILEESHFTLQMDSLKIPSNIYQTNLTATSSTQQSSLFSPSYSSPSWDYPQITTLPFFNKFSLLPPASRPLGLNLNLQSFIDIETTCFGNTIDPHTHQPTSAPSPSPSRSSSSSSYSYMSPAGMSGGATPEVSSKAEKLYPSGPLLHPAMCDEEEMPEIRSISEKHGMDWNDAVNLATSAWWSKFLKNMDLEGGENREGEAIQVFSEVTDAQAWLSDESEMDGYLLDCNADDYLLDCNAVDHLQDVTLPSIEKANKRI